MLVKVLCTQQTPCRFSIHRFQQAQPHLSNGVINSRLLNNGCFALSLSLKKHWSNIFSLTAQSILGLTVAREHMVVLSCRLSALQNEKDWCSTLDQWMDGVGVRAHFAVKRLLVVYTICMSLI